MRVLMTGGGTGGSGGNEEPEEEVIVDFAAIVLSVESEVLLRLRFLIPDEFLNDENAYAVVTEEANEVTKVDQVTTLTSAEVKALGTDSNGRYTFEQGIAAGEMTGDVSVEFFNGEGEALNIRDYADGSLTKKLTRTVLDYGKLSYEKGKESLQNLVTGMFLFGGYAQQYFKVDIANPAYNLSTQMGKTLPDINAVSAETITQDMTTSGDEIGITKVTQKIGLDSSVYMSTYFVADKNIDDYSFTLTYTEGGVEKNIEVEAELESDGRFRVDILDIPVAYWDYMYKITATEKATGKTFEVDSSIMAWAKRCIVGSSNAAQVDMAKAMYYYNQAANAYFNK